jgi:putative ABC transport system permease protein
VRIVKRLRAGSRSRTLAITGQSEAPNLNRVLNRAGQSVTLPADGLVLSKMLGDLLGVTAGDTLQVEVLEGRRPVRRVVVAGLVEDSLGLQAHMHVDAVRRLLREDYTVSAYNRHRRRESLRAE